MTSYLLEMVIIEVSSRFVSVKTLPSEFIASGKVKYEFRSDKHAALLLY